MMGTRAAFSEEMNDMGNASVTDLIGKTMRSVVQNGDDRIVFTAESGEEWLMWHSRDCCENVKVEDITGDLKDLVGSPILKAEEIVHKDEDPAGINRARSKYDDSWTWTFYHFATVNGYVTIRWYGESNGYYSESVDFDKQGVAQ